MRPLTTLLAGYLFYMGSGGYTGDIKRIIFNDKTGTVAVVVSCIFYHGL
jgi:hypothetical protein